MKTKITLQLPLLLFLLAASLNLNLVHAQTVDASIPVTNDGVRSIIKTDQHLYLVGEFTEVDGEPRELIARLNLDGSLDLSWDSPLGGASGGQLNALFLDTHANELYVGGYLPSGKTGIDADGNEQTLSNRTARIDPDTGAFLGSITFLGVNAGHITADENFIYIMGSNGVSRKIDKTTNTYATWNVSYAPGNGQSVHLDANDGFLYIGATRALFDSTVTLPNGFGRVDVNGNIDPTFVHTFDTNIVDVIATDDNYVYAGGLFNNINGITLNNLARFDKSTGQLDTNWHPDTNGRVYAIEIEGDHIYLGGQFTTVGGEPRERVAKINKLTGEVDPEWSIVVNQTVRSAIKQGDNLFIGGDFSSVAGESRANFAKILPPTLGVDKLNSELFSAYPNPTADLINLSFNQAAGNEVTADLFNLMGQRVKQQQLSLETNEHTLNIEELEAGIYLLKITNAQGGSQSVKILKQ